MRHCIQGRQATNTLQGGLQEEPSPNPEASMFEITQPNALLDVDKIDRKNMINMIYIYNLP